MCKHCEYDEHGVLEPIYETEDFVDELHHDDEGWFLMERVIRGFINDRDFFIRINNCPMCGRNLRGES